jgi:hypothetical protein
MRHRQPVSATAQSVPMPVPAAIAVLAAAHLFDLATFIVMTSRHGLDAEANPVVRQLAELAGLPGLTLAKLVAVILGASVFIVLGPKRPKLAAAVLFFGIAAGVIGGITNVASI